MITLTSLCDTYLLMKVAEISVKIWRESFPYKLPPKPTPEAAEYRRIRETAKRREATGRPDWAE